MSGYPKENPDAPSGEPIHINAQDPDAYVESATKPDTIAISNPAYHAVRRWQQNDAENWALQPATRRMLVPLRDATIVPLATLMPLLQFVQRGSSRCNDDPGDCPCQWCTVWAGVPADIRALVEASDD